MENKKKFAEMMEACGVVFDRQITEPLADIYWSVLKKHTDEEIQEAFTKAIHACKFFPKPAELLEFIEGSPEDRIAIAYIQLRKACESIGAYESVIFSDPGLETIIEAWGGWEEVCHLPLEEWQYRQKQFRDLYRVSMDIKREPKKFTGRHEYVNRLNGYAEARREPIRIDAKRDQYLKLVKQ